MVDQIRLKTLLKEDEFYRRWFLKLPKLKVIHTTPPWRLFIQEAPGGRWKRVDIGGYPKACSAVKLRLPDAWDMTIHCKPQGFNPPVLKYKGKRVFAPQPEGHQWCVYCRRPTIFDHFVRHPNIPKAYNNWEERKCSICGAREEPMRKFQSPMSWPISP